MNRRIFQCTGVTTFPRISPGPRVPAWTIGVIAGVFMSALATLLPTPAPACGWWGEGENDTAREPVSVDGEGHVLKGAQQAQTTPEAVTRQANRLRRYGAAGYAGALRLYRQAADAGYAPAQNNLAAMYEEGLGVAASLAEAARWYRIAAEQGEPHAQHSLGMMLLAGRGVQQHTEEGLRWIEQAAQQGHPSACADLGRFYSTGEYLGKDTGKAIYWWEQAERLGYPAADEALDTLRSRRDAQSDAHTATR